MLAGDLPDAIFAADLWEVVEGRAHADYQDLARFFSNSYPTGSLAFLLTEVAGRLAGRGGGVPVFRLETGFGGGKTHSLIAAVHVARAGTNLSGVLSEYNIASLPGPGVTRAAASHVARRSRWYNNVCNVNNHGRIKTMTMEPKKLRIKPNSKLASLLKDADRSGDPILIDTGDAVYPVHVGAVATRQQPSDEDVERSREGIRRAAGTWKDIDVEAFKAYVAARRRSSSRPTVRL